MCNVIRPGVCLLVAVFSLVVSAPARASQEPGAAGAPEAEEVGQQPKPTPQQPSTPTPTPAPRPGNERQPERQPEGRPINLQIEVAITDQVGSEPAEKKIVSMIVADRAWGRVRASGVAQLKETPPGPPLPVRLNVDGRPAIQPNDTIRLELTLEYQPLPPAAEADAARRPSQLHESLTVILHSGKPLTVSRAVDPFTNRRTSVDITATIVK